MIGFASSKELPMNPPQGLGFATAYQSKNLDHLGLVAGVCQELELAKIIDEQIPSYAPDKVVSHGQATVAMILNGLGFINKALYMVPKFFEDKPVDRLLGQGIASDHLNDDALGRTLDALYTYGVTPLFSRISQHAAGMLGLSSKAAHLDSTSFHVDGQYNHEHRPQGEEQVIHITKGYSRDHRSDLNQVCLNLICESQAAIPVFMQAASGNASDKIDFRNIIEQHVLQLRNHLGVEYIVADSSLYTEKTLEMLGAHTPFITRVPETLKEAKDAIIKVNPDEMLSIDDAYSYQVVLSNYAGVRQRWLIMRSEQASRREHRTLIKKISRDTENEYKQFQKLKSGEFACAEDALKACWKLQATFTYGQMLDLTAYAVKKYANRGKPSAKTAVKQTVYRIEGTLVCSISNIREVEKTLGLFILATNDLDDMRLSAQEVLALYKGQSKSERGFKFLKSPYFLAASFFVQKPERIEALLMIMTLCLLVYAALEYRIRQQLRKEERTVPNQVGKPVQNPTARWIFECFVGIHVLNMPHAQHLVLNLQERHWSILQLLGHRYIQLYS